MPPDQQARTVGVLLLYYPSYAETAVRRFRAVLNAVDVQHAMVVVTNQTLHLPAAMTQSAHVIHGDNSLREFSGWQAGVDFCRRTGMLGPESTLICANDTFCHHNKFGPLTRYAFVRAFRRLNREGNAPVLVGEIHRPGPKFSLNNLTFDEWVSTYLFAMNMPLLDKLGSLKPRFDLNACFVAPPSSTDFFTDALSTNLRQHLSKWLFQSGQHQQWKDAQALDASNLTNIVGKAKSILCEMRLSAEALHTGGHLASVFASPLLRQMRRLERLLPAYRHAGKSP